MQLFNKDNHGLIAFNANQNGIFDIWLYNLEKKVTWQLTYGLADILSAPYWSHNSKKIAFVGSGGIAYVVNISDGKVMKIDKVEAGTLLSWSKDNKSLAYSKKDKIVIYNIERHKSSIINQKNTRYAQWFPSGKELLFEGQNFYGVSQLFRINIDGTNKRQITNNIGGLLNDVKLAPSGRFVLYTTPGASISIIKVVNISTGRLIEIKGGPQAKNYNPVWSPSSSKIAYSATDFENFQYYSQIRVVNRQGENDTILSTSSCYASHISWSPYSKKIAYLSKCGDEGLASEIWLLDVTRPVPTILLNMQGIATLSWSQSSI